MPTLDASCAIELLQQSEPASVRRLREISDERYNKRTAMYEDLMRQIVAMPPEGGVLVGDDEFLAFAAEYEYEVARLNAEDERRRQNANYKPYA